MKIYLPTDAPTEDKAAFEFIRGVLPEITSQKTEIPGTL